MGSVPTLAKTVGKKILRIPRRSNPPKHPRRALAPQDGVQPQRNPNGHPIPNCTICGDCGYVFNPCEQCSKPNDHFIVYSYYTSFAKPFAVLSRPSFLLSRPYPGIIIFRTTFAGKVVWVYVWVLIDNLWEPLGLKPSKFEAVYSWKK